VGILKKEETFVKTRRTESKRSARQDDAAGVKANNEMAEKAKVRD